MAQGPRLAGIFHRLCQLSGSLALAEQAVRVYLPCSPLESLLLPPWLYKGLLQRSPVCLYVWLCSGGPSADPALKLTYITGPGPAQRHRERTQSCGDCRGRGSKEGLRVAGIAGAGTARERTQNSGDYLGSNSSPT